MCWQIKRFFFNLAQSSNNVTQLHLSQNNDIHRLDALSQRKALKGVHRGLVVAHQIGARKDGSSNPAFGNLFKLPLDRKL